MNTLVPMAVSNSKPSTRVSTSSIMAPPPTPTKPQMKPMMAPKKMDLTARWAKGVLAISVLEVMTGQMMNFRPMVQTMKMAKYFTMVLGANWPM